jgi:hypothetical protein
LLGLAPVVVFSFLALLCCASPTQAQSGGAFSSAILELTPPRNADGSFKTINSILAGKSAGATFYLEGNVFMNRTVRSDCTLPAGAEDLVNASFVNKMIIFDGPGRRVGIYRMWGVLRDPANAGTTSAGGQSGDNLSGSLVASVNMSIDLESYNATIQLQGTLGKVFGAIESAGHPLTDVLAITGGTGTLRSASGDAVLTPLVDANRVVCSSLGGFQIALQENSRLPRFGNVLPFSF